MDSPDRPDARREHPAKPRSIARLAGLVSLCSACASLAACGLSADQLAELTDAAKSDAASSDAPGYDGTGPLPDVPGAQDVVAHDGPTPPRDGAPEGGGTCATGCDDGNPCTDDACVSGACAHTNNTAACDDGNACNGADTCGSGACSVHASGGSCDDGNPCTDDACGAGGCTHANNTAACAGGTCMGGTCMATSAGCGGTTPELGPPDYSREGSGAVAAGSSAQQSQALVRGNHWRTAAGLSPLNLNAHLNTAAQNHATFCSNNAQASCWPGAHDETMGCAGFTGHLPWDRMTAAGYSWSAASEDMNFVGDPVSAVDGWIWTPYHRHPFLDPSYVDTGYGQVASIDVMDFAATGGAHGTAPSVAVFPVPGQTGVPRSFAGNESPTPPAPPSGWPSGAVISVSLNAAGAVSEHLLWDASCNAVAHTFSNADGFGGTSTQYFYFYANSALAANTRYTARVSGTVGGASYSRTWVFTTAP